MTVNAPLGRVRRRSWLPAVIVTTIGLLWATATYVASVVQPAVSEPAFPSTVGTYSWWTSGLSEGDVDAALVVYQNGIGVEFLDTPQAVVLGTNGSTYRRLGVAERLGNPADQGDPAESVLSPDGTFVVVANPGSDGGVVVATLGDGTPRSIDIGDGRSALPVSIAADGKSVLLLAHHDGLSRYSTEDFRLHGDLVNLNLETGEVQDYPELNDVNSAALSPDGSRIVADTAEGIVVANAADGKIQAIGLPDIDSPYLDGDAWSPDSGSFAFLNGSTLHVVEVAELGGVTTEVSYQPVPLDGVEYGTAIGWRDNTTALVHTENGSGDNHSFFSWVDVESGEREQFSEYTPDFTGAALGSADIARDLVATMQIADLPNNRGVIPYVVNVALVLILGLVVMAVSPARRKAEPEAG